MEYTKKEKKTLKKDWKKAVKCDDIDSIEKHLEYLLKYDEVNFSNKYREYLKSLSMLVKAILNMRQKMKILEEINSSVYETFEKRIIEKIKPEMNGYLEMRLKAITKEVIKVKKQPITTKKMPNPNRKTNKRR